jgi:hypothetical protein
MVIEQLIEYKDIAEFNFESFKIVFDSDLWYAESFDTEVEELIIIEDPENALTLKEDLDIFGVYVLTLEKFYEIKRILGEKIL